MGKGKGKKGQRSGKRPGKKVVSDSGDQSEKGEASKARAKTPEKSTTPPGREPDLPLAAPPVTPTRPAFSPGLTPRLQRAIDSDCLDHFNEVAKSKPVPRRMTALFEKRVNQLVDAFRKIQAEQLQCEVALEDITNKIALLGKAWSDGKIDLNAADFNKERSTMLEQQLELMKLVSILRTKGAELAGKWGDDMLLDPREITDDYAYIDALIRGYPTIANASKSVKSKRTSQQEAKFRKDVLKAYNAEESDGGLLWCPVSGAYEAYVTAAHIVNVNVGERTAQALFGDERRHIWSPENGIPIAKDFETLLDTAQALILPISDAPGETEFEFFLLTKDIGRRKKTHVWGEDLHRRRLVFLNDFRPSKRYLYFKFAINLLRRRRGEVPGYLEDLQALPSPSKALWASPGPYLRHSILFKFSRQLGCLTTNEALQFWGTKEFSEDLSEEDNDLVETMTTLANTSLAEQNTVDDDYEDYEDYEDDEDEDDKDEDGGDTDGGDD